MIYKIEDLALVIVAAGSSSRFGGGEKQMQDLNGIPVFLHSVINLGKIAAVTVVACPKGRADIYRETAIENGVCDRNLHFIEGGASRTESVKNALTEVGRHLKKGIVAIHDGARPLAKSGLLIKLVETAREYGGSAPGKKVTDTLLASDKDQVMTGTVPREGLWAISTPQVFDLEKIILAYEKAGDIQFTDDTQVFHNQGGKVKIVPEEGCNMKITYSEDLSVCKMIMEKYQHGIE